MDDAKLTNNYKKIAGTILETIPEEWTKVLVYGEITDDARRSFFYYYPSQKSEPIYSHDIPELFNINRGEYRKMWRRLLDNLQELRNEFKDSGEEEWTNLTFILEKTGQFKIDYGYEDLTESDDYGNRVKWEYKYLGLIPEDEYAKKFLSNS